MVPTGERPYVCKTTDKGSDVVGARSEEWCDVVFFRGGDGRRRRGLRDEGWQSIVRVMSKIGTDRMMLSRRGESKGVVVRDCVTRLFFFSVVSWPREGRVFSGWEARPEAKIK